LHENRFSWKYYLQLARFVVKIVFMKFTSALSFSIFAACFAAAAACAAA